MLYRGAALLEWDSKIFGLRIGRFLSPRLDHARVEEALRWCDAEGVDCLYVLTASDDAPSVRVAEAHGFRFVDVRLTFARRASRTGVPAPRGGVVRPAREEDIPALQAIAQVSHHDSRFYFDGNFPEGRCDELYAVWIANACRGRSEIVFVAEAEGQPVGYLALNRSDPDEGQIDLLAVHPTAQRRGLGRGLVTAAVDWCAAHGLARLTVVTQGRNVRSQALYQRAGFVTTGFQLWYHVWPSARRSAPNAR